MEFEKERIKLDDAAIKRIQEAKEESEVQRDNLVTSNELLRRQIELNLPMRSAKLQLKQFNKEIERLSNNLKVMEKQIRTKEVINLRPKEKKDKSVTSDKSSK